MWRGAACVPLVCFPCPEVITSNPSLSVHKYLRPVRTDVAVIVDDVDGAEG